MNPRKEGPVAEKGAGKPGLLSSAMIQLQPLAQVPSLCTNSRLELELEVVHLVMGFANPTILPGFYYNNGSLPWVGVPSETQSSSAPVPGRGVSGYFISS